MKKGPKFKRKATTVKTFLKKKGLKKTPKGKEVVHKKSLWKGGTDTTRNLKLQKKSVHAKKTKKEATTKAKRKKR